MFPALFETDFSGLLTSPIGLHSYGVLISVGWLWAATSLIVPLRPPSDRTAFEEGATTLGLVFLTTLCVPAWLYLGWKYLEDRERSDYLALFVYGVLRLAIMLFTHTWSGQVVVAVVALAGLAFVLTRSGVLPVVVVRAPHLLAIFSGSYWLAYFAAGDFAGPVCDLSICLPFPAQTMVGEMQRAAGSLDASATQTHAVLPLQLAAVAVYILLAAAAYATRSDKARANANRTLIFAATALVIEATCWGVVSSAGTPMQWLPAPAAAPFVVLAVGLAARLRHARERPPLVSPPPHG